MRTTFLLERIISDQRFAWHAPATCILCGERFTVHRGQHTAVLRAGNELIGLCCDQCLGKSTHGRYHAAVMMAEPSSVPATTRRRVCSLGMATMRAVFVSTPTSRPASSGLTSSPSLRVPPPTRH